MNKMNHRQALAQMQSIGIERLDSQLLLLYVMGRPSTDRAWLIAHDTDELPEEKNEQLMQLAQRRSKGEPLAYLVGSKEFFGLNLKVDARVLVPRPDTETLVEWALELLNEAQLTRPRVLDLGTGSGAIALAIKYKLPAAQVCAVDSSPGALEVAKNNANSLALEVQFIESHWLQAVDESTRFDVIVSNPPYIAVADSHLADLQHEPGAALIGGPKGLDDIYQIIEQAPKHLNPGGWLLLEHGFDQAVPVQALLDARGFKAIQGRQDLAGITRCSGGRWDNPRFLC